jgi:tetratricopeptide (TPR) repeat protein
VVALAALSLIGMLLTPLVAGSRTVLLAAAAALAVAGWWWLAGQVRFPGTWIGRQLALFWAGLGAALALLIGLLAWHPEWLTTTARSLPGQDPTTGLGRFVLYGEAWRLAQATPFTGGGLGAFPALFSTYMHVIPNFLLAHAHNVYLNLLVEQGWPGVAAYGLALAAAAWAAARALAQPARAGRSLLAAGAAGLIMVAIHGLGDATFAASWATPFALVPAGLVVATLPANTVERRRLDRRWIGALCLLLLGTVAALPWVYKPLLAAWHDNLGAVTLARAQLADWPSGEWSADQGAAALADASRSFQNALAVEPNDQVAHYYLGLIAQQQRDFDGAAAHLERAFAADPHHRGLIKTLGYSDVWLGRFGQAQPLLAQIPEARHELEVYVWWWGQQQRPDLAENARQMAALLAP